MIEYKFINSYIGVNSPNMYNKLFTFIYEDKSFEQLCVHVEEISYKSDKILFKNVTGVEEIKLGKRLLLKLPNKTYDMTILPELFEIMIQQFNLTYEIATKIHDYADSRNPFILAVSDVHGNIPYVFSAPVFLGTYEIVLTECSEDLTEICIQPTSNVPKMVLMYIGDYINPGTLEEIGYTSAFTCFTDNVTLNFIKYEAQYMAEEIKSNSVSSHPLIFLGNHDSWIDQPNQIIYDIYGMWGNDFIHFRHAIFCDLVIEGFKDKFKLYDLYTYEKHTINIGPLTLTVLLSRQPASTMNCIKTFESIQGLVFYDTVEKANNLLEFKKDCIEKCIPASTLELIGKLPERIIFICGHDNFYGVINNILSGTSEITNDDSISIKSPNNIHEQATVARTLYKFKNNIYLIPTDILYTTSRYKVIVPDKLNYHKVQNIINETAINKLYHSYEGNKLKTHEKATDIYKNYLKAYIKFWRELEDSSDFDLLVQEIFSEFIESSIKASTLYYYKKNGKKVDDLSSMNLIDHFDHMTKRINDELLSLEEDVILNKWTYITGVLVGSHFDFERSVVKQSLNNLSVIYCKHNPIPATYNIAYGDIKLVYNLKTLMKLFDVYIFPWDSGCYTGKLNIKSKVLEAPVHIMNEVLNTVFKEKSVYKHSLENLYDCVRRFNNKTFETHCEKLYHNSGFLRLKLTDKLLNNRKVLKRELFKLHALSFMNLKIYPAFGYCLTNITEMFSDPNIRPIEKLHRLRTYLPKHSQYYEYIVDYTNEAREFLNNAKLVNAEPPQFNHTYTFEEFKKTYEECVKTIFSEDMLERFLNYIKDFPKSATYKEYTYLIFKLLSNNRIIAEVTKVLGHYFTVEFKMFDLLKEIYLRLLTDYGLSTTYKQLEEEDIMKYNEIFQESTKKVISAIHSYFTNDEVTFDINSKIHTRKDVFLESKRDYTEYDYFAFKLSPDYVSQYPGFYSLFWNKNLYRELPDDVRYTLNGGSKESKWKFWIKIVVVVLAVVALIIYISSRSSSSSSSTSSASSSSSSSLVT